MATKILVIEDDLQIRENIMETLEMDGYQSYGANNGAEGLGLALQYPPDLVICDIMMPEMDGFEVLEHLRANDTTATIPLIFVTAKTDRQSLRQGMQLGADDFLTKPFNADELLQAVQARLQHHAAVAQHAEKKLEEAKQQLSRMITHELRTPLTSINVVSDLISRQLGSISEKQLNELLDMMITGSKRLNRVVEQMVTMVQLDIGSINYETIKHDGIAVPLWSTLMGAVDLARRASYNRPYVQIATNERDSTVQVLCNRTMLKQAFSEIISNAISYSPEQGTVSLAQWRAKKVVWLSIVDQGRGMSPEQIEQAMELFQQIDRETHEQQGIGLGLPLAHRIIEAHGGKMEIASVAGKGTQITIGLPVYER